MKKISEFTVAINDKELNIAARFTKESIYHLINTHRPKYDDHYDMSEYWLDYNDPYYKNERLIKERLQFVDRVFITVLIKDDILKIKKYHNQAIQIFIANNKKHCVAKFGSKTITVEDRREKSLICEIFEDAFHALNFYRFD